MRRGFGSTGKLVGVMAAVVVVAGIGAFGCSPGGSDHAATSAPAVTAAASATLTVARGTATAVVFPMAPASQDAGVWDFVESWQGDNVSPILRPTYIPPGIAAVTIGQSPNKQDVGLLSVEYSGSGTSFTVLAGALNPSSEGTPPTQVTVRGNPATLATDEAGASTAAVWWEEPGEKIIESGQAVAHPLYEVFARGLSADEALRIANSLTPVGG
jgi:hypothetical protein